MTLAPVQDRNIKPRPDLPAYELPDECQVPFCGRVDGLHNHHLFRRQTPDFRKAWWVELSDGTILPARVALCSFDHDKVDGGLGGHDSLIVFRDGGFFWRELDYDGCVVSTEPLDPHPPLFGGGDAVAALEELGEAYPSAPGSSSERATGHGASAGDEDDREVVRTLSEKDYEFRLHVRIPCPHLELEPGERCEGCNYRKPHQKKADSPVTWTQATRRPVDERESVERVERAVFEHLGLVRGGKLAPFARAKAVDVAYALVLQDEALAGMFTEEGT